MICYSLLQPSHQGCLVEIPLESHLGVLLWAKEGSQQKQMSYFPPKTRACSIPGFTLHCYQHTDNSPLFFLILFLQSDLVIWGLYPIYTTADCRQTQGRNVSKKFETKFRASRVLALPKDKWELTSNSWESHWDWDKVGSVEENRRPGCTDIKYIPLRKL